jgi:hypothetical protein
MSVYHSRTEEVARGVSGLNVSELMDPCLESDDVGEGALVMGTEARPLCLPRGQRKPHNPLALAVHSTRQSDGCIRIFEKDRYRMGVGLVFNQRYSLQVTFPTYLILSGLSLSSGTPFRCPFCSTLTGS